MPSLPALATTSLRSPSGQLGKLGICMTGGAAGQRLTTSSPVFQDLDADPVLIHASSVHHHPQPYRIMLLG